jgi:hypothetical protein
MAIKQQRFSILLLTAIALTLAAPALADFSEISSKGDPALEPICLDCKNDIGPGDFDPPGSATPGSCDGACPTRTGAPIEVCVPDIGNSALPKTGKVCECVPEAESKCDYNHSTRTGTVVYKWAHSAGAYCKYGACPTGQSCKATTGPGGVAACGCSV